MAEIDGLLSIAALGLWIFCIIDVITADASSVRNLEKGWWVLIVLLFSVVGSLVWLVAGRPQNRGVSLPYKGNRGYAEPTSTVSRSRAPDDDPEFLAQVRRQNTEDKDMLARWEQDLRKREEDLRNGGDTPPAPPSS